MVEEREVAKVEEKIEGRFQVCCRGTSEAEHIVIACKIHRNSDFLKRRTFYSCSKSGTTNKLRR